jgi:hypothetical protein
MRSFKNLALAASALFALLLIAAATPAQAQGPRYLHALSDLRQARGWLKADGRPQFNDQRRHAISEIDHAIDEVKKAARDDGKNPDFTPPPQSEGNPGAPVRSALKLLDEARNDVASGQDSPENMGLQVRALQHIDAARPWLQQIVQIVSGH